MSQQFDPRLLIAEIRTNKKLSNLLIIGVTLSQAIVVIPLMYEHDQYPDYYHTILPYTFDCKLDEIPNRHTIIDGGEWKPTRNPIKWWLHCASAELTGFPNALLLPFNFALLPLVYYLGYYMTNDRIIGMIAIGAMLYNPLYADWVNTATYDQVWSFFLLLGMVLVFKEKQKLSTLPMIISVLTKSMVILYFPLWLYTIWKVKRDKVMVISFTSAVAIIGLVLYFMGYTNIVVGAGVGFFEENIEEAIVRNLSLFWQVVPILAVFAVLNNTFRAKVKPNNKTIIIVWMIGILIMTPIIHIFTMQGTFSYRYVPFAAMISIFIGMTFVEMGNWYLEMKMKKAERQK
ncbi:MAG: hypothetical protein GTO02_09970 [Candidatus Dadabacteria bacterium]|nr:hypothetical protein [Candidatus Dadabacteria bacterium]